MDKNNQNEEENTQSMYETPNDPLCPVKSFEKYLSKLHPSCSAFLQLPNPRFSITDSWYVNAPVGIHTIRKMLKTSEEAKT